MGIWKKEAKSSICWMDHLYCSHVLKLSPSHLPTRAWAMALRLALYMCSNTDSHVVILQYSILAGIGNLHSPAGRTFTGWDVSDVKTTNQTTAAFPSLPRG